MARISIETLYPFFETIVIEIKDQQDLIFSSEQKQKLKELFAQTYKSFCDSVLEERTNYIEEIKQKLLNEKKRNLQADYLISNAELHYKKSIDTNNPKWRLKRDILDYALLNSDEINVGRINEWLSTHPAEEYFSNI